MRKLKLGVAGLGRAFGVMLPTLALDPRVELVAAADPRPEARQRFEADFHATCFESVEKLAESSMVEAVYVATPHEMHAGHARLCASRGKHLLVEKPMAITLDECRSMIEAARAAGVHLVVGHSHSFDLPILETRKIIASGSVGRLRMLTALDFTDFLYRPRRPEELDTTKGGGAVFSQAAHQIDIARLLAGSRATSVRASTGNWDPARPTEGAYSCLIQFEDGVHATLVYSGYGHFDSDEFTGWVGEMGLPKTPGAFAFPRKTAKPSEDEARQKMARNYGGSDYKPQPDKPLHQHFGLVIASCERADLRPQPIGVRVYGDAGERLEPLPPPKVPRSEVIDELYEAVVNGRPPPHSGESALATLEICLAILESGRSGKEIELRNQTALRT